MSKHSYKQNFLEFGFTSINDHGVAKPQCVLCYAVLSNESLKENKLKRHFETKHPQYVKKNRIYFQHREAELKRSRFCSATNPAIFGSKQATLASYVVAQRIAREMKPHTIGKRLVKPAAIDMTRLICGDDVASKLQSVSLSNDTVKSRIADLSLNIKNQVVARMRRAGKWSYQLDESTDTGKDAQLMVYVRYEGELDLEEEFLFCTPLTTTATGADIYNVVDNFHKKEGVDWKNCVSLCTDGAPAMLGARQGFTARVKQVNPNVQIVQCLLHRENLAAQHLSSDLSAVMQEVVGIVNFIKFSAVNSRLFEQMCVDFGSQFHHLLFYSNVRWLSRGKLLRRLVDLRTEVQFFLNDKKHRHAIRFEDKEWMLKVCYLNDIFALLNDLNLSMQGRNQNIRTISERLSAFKEKTATLEEKTGAWANSIVSILE
uniref:protein FAM200B-like n=1 Tax=Styela clava TaxID=7725 RepID=UPI00193A8A22|nr:protein FAM200B-like [Styela clava]